MSDEEFMELCRRIDPYNVEMTKEGLIRLMIPPSNDHSRANAGIIAELCNWRRSHREGWCFDGSTLFTLPDGSKLGPDAAYITEKRLPKVPHGFAHVCPNFVIELLSATDSLDEAKEKMRLWIDNGAELGWLIDPSERVSYVFSERVQSFSTDVVRLHGVGPVAGFVLDLTDVWEIFTR